MAEAWLAGASAALDEMEADPSLTLVSSPAFVDMARRLKILAPRGAQFRGGDAPQLDPEKRAKLQEQKMRLLGEIVSTEAWYVQCLEALVRSSGVCARRRASGRRGARARARAGDSFSRGAARR